MRIFLWNICIYAYTFACRPYETPYGKLANRPSAAGSSSGAPRRGRAEPGLPVDAVGPRVFCVLLVRILSQVVFGTAGTHACQLWFNACLNSPFGKVDPKVNQ